MNDDRRHVANLHEKFHKSGRRKGNKVFADRYFAPNETAYHAATPSLWDRHLSCGGEIYRRSAPSSDSAVRPETASWVNWACVTSVSESQSESPMPRPRKLWECRGAGEPDFLQGVYHQHSYLFTNLSHCLSRWRNENSNKRILSHEYCQMCKNYEMI